MDKQHLVAIEEALALKIGSNMRAMNTSGKAKFREIYEQDNRTCREALQLIQGMAPTPKK